MSWLKLLRASHTVALSSLVAFGTQIAFALLMLRLFTPQEVGEFSVLSQVGFFWMTLALAQAPLGLLANVHTPADQALRLAWRSSVRRGLLLLPFAALALWLSHLSLWPALLWVLLLAFFQMGNLLSQSYSLRAGSAWQQAAVRVLPPLTAALFALTTAWLTHMGTSQDMPPASANLQDLPVLVIAAILGYAVGAAWLVPAICQTSAQPRNGAEKSVAKAQVHLAAASSQASDAPSPQQSDNRSATLRMAHTLADALLATALVVVWQRLYGAQETGWMTALLRVLGFVPAVVHMAWAQVVLAQGPHEKQDIEAHASAPSKNFLSTTRQRHHKAAVWLGLSAFSAVVVLGGVCALALNWQWLDTRWDGVWAYIVPLVLWQGCACISAAFSHRPFQTHAAARYSWTCMGLALLQAVVLLAPLGFAQPMDAAQHMLTFALVSSLGLFGLTTWMARLR
ncbi:hypothetical protein C5F52_17320 [Limnohabitans sp. TS-CS-82]|uniref:hypothetical protein n=1 Tax=Limnohabitans sp. TS-CS-82 TaxID=2094193 RepID=UPI000CF2B20B|nr:hypothetical protein [Limnohabitans sp. TS-CS-82]PQA81785.1 hypothetical protein C5F52_17320 [Limnohabitans sp. TS-CS-82]